MCLILAGHFGAFSLVATDRRWRFSPPGEAVRYVDRGGKLVGTPAGWIAASGSGRAAFAALAAASACTTEAEVGRAVRAATDASPGKAFLVGATADRIWTSGRLSGGPGTTAAKGAVGGRGDTEMLDALDRALRGASNLEAVLRAVRSVFAEEAAITLAVSPECDVGLVYPDGRRERL